MVHTHTHTHTMSRYIVSNGVGMSTSDKVFDLVWNSFGNKELFDSDKSSSLKNVTKTVSSREKPAKSLMGEARWILDPKTK